MTGTGTPLSDDALSLIYRALAHPVRRQLLGHLTAGTSTTALLAGQVDLSVPTVRRHVALLAEAGLVSRERSGRQVLIRLTAGPVRDADAYLRGFRPFWESPLAS